MTQVSKYPISDIVYKRIFEIFSKSLVKIESKNEASQFIEDFLTPSEQVMLAKRLAIAFLLDKGYDFREIHKILRVSFTTINRVKLMKKIGGGGYQKIINKLLTEEQVKDFILRVGEMVTTEFGRVGTGKGAWRYLHHELEKRRRSKPF